MVTEPRMSPPSPTHIFALLAWGRACMHQGSEGDRSIEVTKLFELLEEFMHEIYTNGAASRSAS